MSRRSWLGIGLVAASLTCCQTPPPEAYVAAGTKGSSNTAVPIGNNEAGEPCRYQLVAGGGAVASRRDAVIYCGNLDLPIGRISELADAADPGTAAQSGSWRAYIDQRFSCSAPSQTQIVGGSAAMMQCTRRVGGWPHVALTASIGGHVYGADVVRPALPALEATLAALSGQAGPSVSAGGSEARRLIAQRTGSGSFGSGDEGRYFQQIRLGDAYNNIDDPASAERAYREALAIQQKVLGQNDSGLALTMMKLAAQIAHQRSGPEADELLGRAEKLMPSGDSLARAQLDFYAATVAAYEGKTGPALARSQAAEDEFSRLVPEAASRADRVAAQGGPGGAGILRGASLASVLTDESPTATQDRAAVSGLGEAMRLRATLLHDSGKRAESAALAQRAQRLLDVNGLSISSTGARSLRLLASNQAVAGDYSAAAGFASDAERVFSRVTPGERPEALNLLSEGAYRLRANRVSAALDSFRKAAAILRSPTVSGGARPEYVGPWLDALYAASEDRGKLAAEMFEAAQFARSSLTAQDIAQATARLAAGDPKVAEAIRGYQDRQREFDTAQAERDRAVAEGTPADRIAAIDKRIDAAREARDEAASVIPAAAPHYLEAVEKPAGVDELRALLGRNEAFVSFFVSDTGSYGFVILPAGITVYRIPLNRAEIAQSIERLRDTTVAKPGGLPGLDFDASYKLYAALFGPAEKQLAGIDRITVATSGDLLRYPMEALVTQAGVTAANRDYRQVPFLVRRAALTYVPSPRVLVNLRKAAPAGASRPFIGFGDFRPASAAQLAATIPPERCRDDYQAMQALPALPSTRAEVTTIAQQLGAGSNEVVLGEAFTKQRLAALDLAQYRIIMLATHAFLPGELRCLSEPAIIVSAPAQARNADGEFERVSDIDNLKLNASLVVLSACNTAGTGGVGESLSGLARSFFRAGARGLLVTHWEVASGAAVPLTTGTFGAGGGTRDSAQALRAAQLRMIDGAGSGNAPIEASHPNYWAAFVVIGDGVRDGAGT